MKKEILAILQNSQGATKTVGGFNSTTAAVKHVRANYGKGWDVKIVDQNSAAYQNSGEPLKSFALL